MELYKLENDFLRVTFLTTGATIYTFEVKPLNYRNIVLSTKDISHYKTPDNGYFGASVGPVAGRLKEGKFLLNGVTYHTEQNEKVTNTLHGGFHSFAFKEFNVLVETNDQLVFEYNTAEDEGGFPGMMSLRVIYTLKENGLELNYQARCTKDTIINITNHSYFNLDGGGNILDHTLKMNATAVYELDEKQINIKPIKVKRNSVFNVRNDRKLKDIVLNEEVNKAPTMGLDHLFMVSDGVLTLTTKDLTLVVSSNYPGFQLYSTNFPPKFPLINNEPVNLYHGLAIEPVALVTSNTFEYKNLELKALDTYEKTITYEVIIL